MKLILLLVLAFGGFGSTPSSDFASGSTSCTHTLIYTPCNGCESMINIKCAAGSDFMGCTQARWGCGDSGGSNKTCRQDNAGNSCGGMQE